MFIHSHIWKYKKNSQWYSKMIKKLHLNQLWYMKNWNSIGPAPYNIYLKKKIDSNNKLFVWKYIVIIKMRYIVWKYTVKTGSVLCNMYSVRLFYSKDTWRTETYNRKETYNSTCKIDEMCCTPFRANINGLNSIEAKATARLGWWGWGGDKVCENINMFHLF